MKPESVTPEDHSFIGTGTSGKAAVNLLKDTLQYVSSRLCCPQCSRAAVWLFLVKSQFQKNIVAAADVLL